MLACCQSRVFAPFQDNQTHMSNAAFYLSPLLDMVSESVSQSRSKRAAAACWSRLEHRKTESSKSFVSFFMLAWCAGFLFYYRT